MVVRLVVVALAVMAALTPLQAAAAQKPNARDPNIYFQKILTNPAGGDEVLVNRVFRNDAQGLSDRLFGAVAKVLGGQAPKLNFVQAGTLGAETGISTNLTDRPGFPKGTINLDPSGIQYLVHEQGPFHSSAVNAMPHEFMHTRQTPQVLASIPDREGGAQAFADIVTPIAAAIAKTHYDAGFYDGPYTDFVKAAQARGRDWILGEQMGKPAVSWP